jgi:hypothetical protein
MFAHGPIAVQIVFGDAPKRTQEMARGCPQPCARGGMHLPEAIPLVIAGPFLLAVTHGGMETIAAVVALPFIRVTEGVFGGVAVYVLLPRLPISMRGYAQSALPTVPANGPDDGRTIILIGPLASAFVRTAARRVAGMAVFVPFFPPRSATSPQFPSQRPVTSVGLTSHPHWRGAACATDGHTDAKAPVLLLTRSLVRLCKSHVLTPPPGAAPDCSPQKWFPYRGYTSGGSGDSGNRRSPACASEPYGPLAVPRHISGTASPWGESVARPTRYFPAHPRVRLWGTSWPTFTIECTD